MRRNFKNAAIYMLIAIGGGSLLATIATMNTTLHAQYCNDYKFSMFIVNTSDTSYQIVTEDYQRYVIKVMANKIIVPSHPNMPSVFNLGKVISDDKSEESRIIVYEANNNKCEIALYLHNDVIVGLSSSCSNDRIHHWCYKNTPQDFFK
jgi:hypothetical protein